MHNSTITSNKYVFCIIKKGQAKEEKLEEAPAAECPLMCPMIYAPLCGSDGKT